MATITTTRSISATLSSTTVDLAELVQPWDLIEISNLDDTNDLTITDDGSTTPSAGLEGSTIIPAGATKVIHARQIFFGAVDGTNVFHRIRILGNGGAYVVEGLTQR